MHRYRIVAQISLVLSILNLVLAAPVVVQKIHETRGDEMVVVDKVAAMPKKWRELEAASYRSTSPRSSQPDDAMTSPQPEVGSTSSGPSQPEDEMASPQPEDAIASPQPEVGSTSSGPSQSKDAMTSPQPEDGSTSSGSSNYEDAVGYFPPEDGLSSSGSSQHEEAMASPQHSDGSASSGYEYPTPHLSPAPSGSGYLWLLDRPPRLSPNRPPSMHDSDSISARPNSGLMGMTFEQWWRLPPVPLQELTPLPHGHHPLSSGTSEILPVPPSPQAPLQELTPLPHGPHPSSSGTSEILHPPPQPTGLDPATTEPEGLAPSHHLASGGSPPLPSSLPTETPLFNKEKAKGVKILAGTIIVGGVIGGIVGFEIKHQKSKDG